MPPAFHLVLATQGAVPEKQVALQELLAGARALPDVELRQPSAQPADAQQPGAQPAESRGPLIRAPLLPAQGECPEHQGCPAMRGHRLVPMGRRHWAYLIRKILDRPRHPARPDCRRCRVD